jgi:hypothetical protein
MTMASSPLVATINPDPLLLETMILKHDWEDAQNNNGDDDSQLNFEPLMPPAPLPQPVAPPATPLGNVLGSANPNLSAAAPQQRLSAAEILALMQEEKPPQPEPTTEPAPEPQQAPAKADDFSLPLPPSTGEFFPAAEASPVSQAAPAQAPQAFEQTSNFAPVAQSNPPPAQTLSEAAAPSTDISAEEAFASQFGQAPAAGSLSPLAAATDAGLPAPLGSAASANNQASGQAIPPAPQASFFPAQPQAKTDDFFMSAPVTQTPAAAEAIVPPAESNLATASSQFAAPDRLAGAEASLNQPAASTEASQGQASFNFEPQPKTAGGSMDFFAAAPMPQAKPQDLGPPRTESATKQEDFFTGKSAAPQAPAYSQPASEMPKETWTEPVNEDLPEQQQAPREDIGLLARRARKKQTEQADATTKHDEETQFDKVKNVFAGEMQIAGKPFPKLAIAVGGFVLLILGFNLLGLVFGAVGGMFSDITSSQRASNMPSLNGQYKFGYLIGQTVHRGQFVLEQKGNDIYGNGQDDAQFAFSGKFNPPKIQFAKQYVSNGQPVGKPILWSGVVDFPANSGPHMQGTYSANIAQGVFRFRRVITVSGRWEARMTQMVASDTTNAEQAANIAGPAEATKTSDEKIKDTQGFFLKIAIGVIFFCVLLAMGSLKLFGPSGLINIWAKKEYIPSQFKSQHNKMLSEMGKGVRPGGLPLGTRMEWGLQQFWMPKNLALPPSFREQNPHTLIIGAGAKGKTRLLANMITSDIKNDDRSVVVIDSNGGLIDLLVDWIASQPNAEQLSKRVIVMDPTHKGGQCPAYNPLELHEDGDLQGAASSIVNGFKAIYTEAPGSQSQWNQQTANILRSSVLLLMANGRTLTDLPNLLSDNDFRDIMLEKIERQKNEKAEYIALLETWGQYKRLARTDQWITWVEPILNRVTPMLSDPRIRPILTKAKGDLDLSKFMTERKILLVKIPKADLLGSLLVTGLKQAGSALDEKHAKHPPCAVYLDEFDNLLEKETISSITQHTKKLKIGLTMVSRSLQQLPEDFRNHLIIQVGMMCVFSLAKKDADMLGPQMFRVDGRKIKHQTIQNMFNKVNSTPQFELISDEEKLNIDRVVGQEERTFFCYRVGTVAGVFHLKVHEFKDIAENQINWAVVEQMYGNNDGSKGSG